MKKRTKISDKALELINQQKIRPIPKWEFVIKNWGLGFGLVISLSLLVMGVGVSWFGLIDNIITPYLWLIVAIIFLGISYILFEKTKKAYRFSKWQVAGFMVIVGLVVGGILFKVGLAKNIDRNFEKNIPYYRQVVPVKLQTWNRPESGYLSGVITKVINYGNFEIQDFTGKMWNINSQDTVIKGKIRIESGQEIKLIGEKTGGGEFQAKEIRPWAGRRN